VEIALPPLRERRDDIPLLTEHFLNIFKKKFEKGIEGFSDEVVSSFMNHSWPGNIRELEHAVEHACALTHDRIIRLDHLPPEFRSVGNVKRSHEEIVDANEMGRILKALDNADWNKAKAARLLGISRQTIYRKISEFNLEKPPEKPI
jgi:two-component system, NtrC family, response regulator HydG